MKRNVLFVLVMAVTSICSGQWLERQVVLGDTFGGIALVEGGGIVVNPISGNVYIESNPIQIFNPVTREKLRGPDVAYGKVVFFPASNKGYIFDESDSALIIDAAADTAIGVTGLPFLPSAWAYSLSSNRLYLGSSSSETLYVFDPDGDTILHGVGVGADVRSLLWDSTWNRAYVGTESGQVVVIDCAADTLLAEVQVGTRYVSRLALSTVSSKLYCVAGDTGLTIVSTDSLTTIGLVRGLGGLDSMIYCPATNRMFCPEYPYDLSVLDCQADTVRARLEVQSLVSMAVSTLNGRAYLGGEDSARVLVVDTTDTIVGTIPLPTVPTHDVLALAFRPDRNELYGVTSPGDLAFIIDASAGTVSDTVSYADYSPRQMVHNPAGNKLYLFCPSQDHLLVMDSTFEAPKHILGGATSTYGRPVLNPALNRLYVADGGILRVVDCNSDSMVRTHDLYGISRPLPVFVPYLNRLYVFSSSTGSGGDSAYAYDCLRDVVSSIFLVSEDVPCAVYDPRSNRVFFACRDAPTVRALDPVTNSVVKTFDLVGGSYNGRMALDPDLGRLYYTDQSPEMMFNIDVLGDSVISSESLPWDIDAMFLNRRLGKLFMCSRDTSQALVFDCAQGTIVDTFDVGHTFTAGLMDDLHDKLYLGYGVVVDCRYDSVVTHLDSFSPSCMAWDMVDNRVFQATTSRLYVYRDDPYGIEEQMAGLPEKRHATIVRGVLFLPPSLLTANSSLLSIDGRKVLDLQPGANDVRTLPAGVYFIRSGPSAVSRQPSAVTKVVIQR